MRPSGEIARMAYPTRPMATDRVRGRYRTSISPHPSYSRYIGGSTEFHGLAILAVFGGLEIGLRCARYAGWVCIRCIYDLRRPPGYSLSPQKSVKRLFRGQKAGRSWFPVRHNAGVFRPNGRHQRNANGEKTLKPRSFGFWGGRTEKVEAKKPNRKSAKCAILEGAGRSRGD